MKTVDFSETIEACDLKVGRYRQLFDFIQKYTKIQTGFSQKLLGHSEPNFV